MFMIRKNEHKREMTAGNQVNSHFSGIPQGAHRYDRFPRNSWSAFMPAARNMPTARATVPDDGGSVAESPPGPEDTIATPALPVMRPIPPAMKAGISISSIMFGDQIAPAQSQAVVVISASRTLR